MSRMDGKKTHTHNKNQNASIHPDRGEKCQNVYQVDGTIGRTSVSYEEYFPKISLAKISFGEKKLEYSSAEEYFARKYSCRQEEYFGSQFNKTEMSTQ